MNQKPSAIVLLFIIGILLGLALLVAFTGCAPIKRAANIFDRHRTDAAMYCLSRFPTTDSTHETVRYIAGKDSIRVDTLYYTETVRDLDTIYKYRNKAITITKFRIDTVYSTLVQWKENKAAISTLLGNMDILKAKIKELTANYKYMKLRFGIVVSLLLAIILFAIYKYFRR